MQWRTDLAMERFAGEQENRGVDKRTYQVGNVLVHEVEIKDQEAEKQFGKKAGKYVTLCDHSLGKMDCDEENRRALAEALAKVVESLLPQKGDVLVVGLGNRHITADALGSQVVEKMLVTRPMQLAAQVAGAEKLRCVCAIAPGVLGVTGIETAEIIRGVVEKVHPRAVVVIDALAARESKRICTTIQVTDTGISPGSGVGNHRMGLNRDTLGVPVVAVGVPMVVYASVIARDALEMLLGNLHMSDEENNRAVEEMVNRVTEQALGELVVTPREVDELVGRVSGVVALGINRALQKTLDAEEILMLTNDHL